MRRSGVERRVRRRKIDMCGQKKPINELKELKFAVVALVAMYPKGSYDRENADNAARGICERIDWVIRQLIAANEGNKNMGA